MLMEADTDVDIEMIIGIHALHHFCECEFCHFGFRENDVDFLILDIEFCDIGFMNVLIIDGDGFHVIEYDAFWRVDEDFDVLVFDGDRQCIENHHDGVSLLVGLFHYS